MRCRMYAVSVILRARNSLLQANLSALGTEPGKWMEAGEDSTAVAVGLEKGSVALKTGPGMYATRNGSAWKITAYDRITNFFPSQSVGLRLYRRNTSCLD